MPVTADIQLEEKVIWATLCCRKQQGSPKKKAELFDAKNVSEALVWEATLGKQPFENHCNQHFRCLTAA